MPRQLEKKLIEDYLVEELQNRGWSFVENKKLERESVSEPLLINNFKSVLMKLNQDIGITEKEINEVLNEIRSIPVSPDGIARLLDYFKYGIGVKFEQTGVVEKVKIFDYEEISNNEFIVSKQVYFRGREAIRTDILLFVNGIPLVNIECKNPFEIDVSWENAYDQIKNYENIVPELYKYVQIGIAVGEKARYFPVVPWQKKVIVYEWKKEGIENSVEAVLEFLRPEKVLDILRNFLFIREERGEMTKVIARYMQYRAVNKIVDRVIKNLEGKEDKNKGLIWHWQGSGKTLTMVFSAHKLYFDKKLENPTIFFIVDRIDLETQLSDEFNFLRLNMSLEKIDSVSSLVRIIKADNLKGKRGIFLTLLHKFKAGEEEIINLNKELENAKEKTIADRKNVICFLDEVHRSQYGLMAAQMKKILKNAFFFGFTGTPIAEEDRNTYITFGYPLKDEEYLDKYFVDDSIKDGFTVPIVYQPRLEDKVHLRGDYRKYLEAFLNSKIEDLGEVGQEKIDEVFRRQLNEIKVFLENPQRIKLIAQDIAEHFRENLDGKFKAMVVTGSRKACVLYKRFLDEFLPKEYSEVVMTYQSPEKGDIVEKYRKELIERFPQCRGDIRQINISIRDSFRFNELPKILIVTDMLITGFDAPILQTIYLDKLLKKHRLLQTIARTNRPYEDLKEAGIIIDYVGILNELEKAFERYYEESEISGVIFDYEFLKNEFVSTLTSLDRIFENIPKIFERESFFDAFEKLSDLKVENDFVQLYRHLRKIFEMLGSNEIKIELYEKYKWYTALYNYYLKTKKTEEEQEKINKYFKKTLEIIHQSVEINKIDKSLPPISLDEHYFEKIKASNELTKGEKAVNMLFGLHKFVLTEQSRNPAYKDIYERIKDLIKQWQERKISYNLLYDRVSDIQEEINEKEKERKEFNLSYSEFGIFSILEPVIKNKNKSFEETKKLIEKISNFTTYNEWFNNPALKQRVNREIRKFLANLKIKYQFSYEEFQNLVSELKEFIENYG